MKRNAVVAMALIAIPFLGGCGPSPAGPDVRGMTLPDAKTQLTKAGITVSTHAKDAAFGVLVEENFVVCDEAAVNEHMVRLEVAKRGC